MSSALAGLIRDEIVALLSPLTGAAATSEGRAALLRAVGHGPDAATHPGLTGAIQNIASSAHALAALDDATLTTWSGITTVLQATAQALTALRSLQAAVTDATLATELAGLGADVANHLVTLHLRVRHPGSFRVAGVLALVEPAEVRAPAPLAVTAAGDVGRFAWSVDVLHPERIDDLLASPWSTLKSYYLPNDLAAATDVQNAAQRLFPLLGLAAQELGLIGAQAVVSLAPAPPPATGPVDTDADELDHFSGGTLDPIGPSADAGALPPPPPPTDLTPYLSKVQPRLSLTLPQLDNGLVKGARFALDLRLSSAQHPGGVAGISIVPTGSFAWSETRGSWKLSCTLDGSAPSLVISPTKGLSLATGSASGAVHFAVENAPPAGGGPAFVFGSASGTRLELGSVRFGADVIATTGAQSASVSASATTCKLVIAPGDSGDGFLQSVLPKDGFGVDFDLGIELSSDRGVTFKGHGGLDLTAPVNLSVAGVASVDGVHLALGAGAGGAVTAEASALATVQIGPIAASIARMGITATVAFPGGGGNLGPADLTVAFKPPSGVGLALDAGVVNGGGFLSFDPAQGQYSGAVQLSVRDTFGIDAIGLLATRLPGGASGYSLLLLGAATFTPIPVGFGFRLTGLGAVLGLNRAADVDKMSAALRDGTLANRLFPENPAANAPAVIAGLDAIMPARQGATTVGVLAKLDWGPGVPLADIDLGLVYDTSAPKRLVAIGKVSVDKPLLTLNLLALGVLDFDQQEIDLDARLYDSKVADFAVYGDAALMMRWGDNPCFLLSIGGFHPGFTPPAQFTNRFPSLQRITVRAPFDESLIKLTLSAYFALTSNTVQFGASAQIHVSVSAFDADGKITFDALAQLSPFRFRADVTGSLSVSVLGMNLFGVSVSVTVAGPGDWYVKGSFTISVLWWDVSFDFGPWGHDTTGAGLPLVDPSSDLKTALSSPSSWGAILPDDGGLVAVRRPASSATALLFHPLADVEVRQHTLPLGVPVSLYAAGKLAQTTTFDIVAVSAGTARDSSPDPVTEPFARAQFQPMTDAQKLSAPSFEPMKAGVRADFPDAAAPPATDVTWDYQVFTLGPKGPTAVVGPARAPDTAAVKTAVAGSAATAARRTLGNGRYNRLQGVDR